MDPLTAFAGANIATFFLVLTRISGLFLLAPVFSARQVPKRFRIALAVALSITAMPGALTHRVELDPAAYPALVAKELLIGITFAFVIAAAFAAVEAAGALIDLAIGFSIAQVVNPLTNASSSLMTNLYGLLASMVLLSTGAHLVLVAGLVRSFEVLPVDAMPPLDQIESLVRGAMLPLLGVALQIAAPIVGVLFVADIGFAILARIVPQLNPFAAQFAVKILLGMGVLTLALPFTIESIGAHIASSLQAAGLAP